MLTCTWDLETSDLIPGRGRILCASFRDSLTEEITTFINTGNLANDAVIALKCREHLEQYYLTDGWYSKGFDFAFLNTRLVKYGERPVIPALHFDGYWYTAGWRGIKPGKRSLAMAARFFGLEDEKMHIDYDVWVEAAMGGDVEAMHKLVERCESDVTLTYQVNQKILSSGLAKNIQRYP
jgi:hypothetical protein